MKKLGFAVNPSSVISWGKVVLNMTIQMIRNKTVQPIFFSPPTNLSVNPLEAAILNSCYQENKKINFPVLHGINEAFTIPQQFQKFSGKKNIAKLTFENTQFPKDIKKKATKFDFIFTPSKWNHQLMLNQGINNTLIYEGVDPHIYHPAPKLGYLNNRFVIFSGGKIEFRKGQDLVIAAFKKFHQKHPEALLIVAWNTHFPQFIFDMTREGHIQKQPEINRNGQVSIHKWLVANDLAPFSFIALDYQRDQYIAEIIREADVALLPSRSEAGTNLFAKECAACATPLILSANTGHLELIDLIGVKNCYPLKAQKPVRPMGFWTGTDGWGESSPDEIVEKLEEVYQNRKKAAQKGLRASANLLKNRTWAKQTDLFLKKIDFLYD
jgi:glycosyltransferase involved in cell wall biosynthesis